MENLRANLINSIPLSNRAILTLSGPDRKNFLQGLITNNVEKIAEGSALYAALLTPQGKYLHDFFIFEKGETLYLDAERARLPDLFRRLMMYKLRAAVDIIDHSAQYTVFSDQKAPIDDVIFAPDPRHSQMGFRVLRPHQQGETENAAYNDYDQLRLNLGLADGSRDFDIDKTLILEGNLENLNGVDFEKGCYVGQEVTARMKHRTNLKKRLLPVDVDGPLPDRGTEITNDAGKKIGDIRSGLGNRAIGYFRLADLTFDHNYHCGHARVTPRRPDWLQETDI
ncbi:MAG: folate-binding protein YgfZ [Emcibacter sp.]|nr:folate-binding protein YgfZ [Emcibacter sp.]